MTNHALKMQDTQHAAATMPEFKTFPSYVDYEDACDMMETRVNAIRQDGAAESVWFLEHPPIYTAGTSAKDEDLLEARFPVYKTGRGGEHTYHGPGQRTAYVMLDLQKRQKGPDLKHYVWQLEEWIIQALAAFGVKGERRCGRVGIWVEMKPYGGLPGAESKIAAIGVRIRRWVTYHGIAVNIDPDLSHFGGIVPCGITEHGVTSLVQLLKRDVSMKEFDAVLKDKWAGVFEVEKQSDVKSCEKK